MPRRPRVFVDGAIDHVYCRFAHGARVLAVPEEAERFLAIVRDVKRTDGLTTLAWCLMPTHDHLALRTGHRPLWRSLRVIQGRFALGHNRRHKTLRPLWQGRYKAWVVEGQDGGSTAPKPLRVSVEKVLGVVEQATGLTRKRLASEARDRATVAARELLAVVGRCLGRSADTESRWLSRRGERRLPELSFGR